MNPDKWRVQRSKWGLWYAKDPKHVFTCGGGCRCVSAPTFEHAINYAQKEARR